MINTASSENMNPTAPTEGLIRLINGEVIHPEEFDKILMSNCHYIHHVIVTGNDKPYPLALIFPDSKLFSQPDYAVTPLEGCFCPRDTQELGKCLTGCMRLANNELDNSLDRVQRGVIINDEFLFADGIPVMTDDEILEKYARVIDDIYSGKLQMTNNLYYINSYQNGSHL